MEDAEQFAEVWITADDGSTIVGGDNDAPILTEAEDARRIVACVNACKGIPTEMLEKRQVRVIAGPPIRDGKRQQPEFYATGTIDDLKAIVQQIEADHAKEGTDD